MSATGPFTDRPEDNLLSMLSQPRDIGVRPDTTCTEALAITAPAMAKQYHPALQAEVVMARSVLLAKWPRHLGPDQGSCS